MLLLFLLCTAKAHAAGVTIITHGLNGDIDDWVIAMAAGIVWHPYLPGTNAVCYEVQVRGNAAGFVVDQVKLAGGDPKRVDSGEIVIKLDWRGLANNSYSTFQVAAAFVPKLIEPNFIPELGRPIVELPIHLIGHSRGGSLVCEISKLLGVQGVWVDHLTTLDPHPLNNDGFDDWPLYTVIDARATVYENILFADNYWQNMAVASGRPVHGAYNRRLTDLGGGYTPEALFDVTASHSDVHLWYHGTVDWVQTPTDDLVEIIGEAQRGSWWTTYEVRGKRAGFYYSRLGCGDRLNQVEPAGIGTGRIKDGYNQIWDFGAGTSFNRTALPSNLGLWPNILQVSVQNTNSALLADTPIRTNFIHAGSTLSVELFYQYGQSVNTYADLRFFLDPDGNPYNSNETILTNGLVPGTGTSHVQPGGITLPITSTVRPGWYKLGVRISNDVRTRYLYTTEIVVIGVPPTPTIKAISKVAGSFRLQLDGLPGQRVIVQASNDLSVWVPVSTNILAMNGAIFTDSTSSAQTMRFYRGVVAP